MNWQVLFYPKHHDSLSVRSEMWLINNNKSYNIHKFISPNQAIWSCALGNIDDDPNSELLLLVKDKQGLERTKLLVYGKHSGKLDKNSDKVSPPPLPSGSEERKAARKFHWDGSSTIVRCDMKIVKMEVKGVIKFGIFQQNQGCITVDFSAQGARGNSTKTLSFYRKKQHGLGSDPYNYDLHTWYRVEIEYIQPLKEARLRVWQMESVQSPAVLVKEKILALSKACPH